ncbi:PP2C family protein-serine/threonine phosphatase [Fluviicola taffensis]|uniref:Protein serine/threonine phosphatase n=1 Tax=Fluviicola taffensis (strain DSM 16823 / NCIMB 13979 / RW262) TaxID=755732 RepID=F2IGE7_FLUTR|nr:SpoIIE family protein phosphatase [Fluviicola taffensis]AEA45813.1 protein serine/threonine phosphatase [Fluviicola taffensis DSM 16823]
MINKIGKLLLGIGLIAFLTFLISEIIGHSILVENVVTIVYLLLMILFIFLGITFIYLHSSVTKRKRVSRIILGFLIFLACFGVFSKLMFWPGAAVEIILFFFLLSFSYFPFIIKSRYERLVELIPSKVKVIYLSVMDLIGLLCLVMGALFIIQKWPFALPLLAIGILIFLIAMNGWNRNFKREVALRKVVETELKSTLEELHRTHLEITERHKEIKDSINYAERIQRSFLATESTLSENLNDYFVIFQPRDVVSGDFYWASKLASGNFLLLTGDSTGHGVPGAIMSLLNITSLEKAIEHQTEPAQIFNEARMTIIERLKNDGSIEGGKDGMDGSLISFNKDKTRLTYTSANNSIWIARYSEETNSYDLLEFKGDKMPLGKHVHDTISFNQTEVQLMKEDVVYCFTDGFADQFGGPKGKKFMNKQLKELILRLASLPLNEQKTIILQTFNDWKGLNEQIDDVTMIAVRI